MIQEIISIILLSVFIQIQAAANFSLKREEFQSIAEENLDSKNLTFHSNDSIRYFKTKEKTPKYIIMSSDYVREYGYSGETNLIVIFNNEGNIKNVSIYESGDTPAFVRKISNSSFLEQFVDSSKESKIDAVSGATITSNTIEKTIKKLPEIIYRIINTKILEK